MTVILGGVGVNLLELGAVWGLPREEKKHKRPLAPGTNLALVARPSGFLGMKPPRLMSR